MSRLFFLVVALGIVAFAVALLGLGAFPPTPHPHPVEKVLPNDRFQRGPGG
ncbi:MAG TPA: hypothetical protein VHS58_08500 [Acetobacteraceae bacterium]|jgi:hypothetical protein|nr:hypothetical protein [Acetobacteraceae bacterium]